MKAAASRRLRLFLFSMLLGAVAAIGWFLGPGRAALRRTPNVILISIDTCRADHLGCYGHPGDLTPHVDAIADEGILFSNVITPAPTTLPAHSSMLTGTVPPYHGVHANIAYRLRDSNVTLAEILREHGFSTAAAVGGFALDSQFGIAQGFDFYDDEFETAGTIVSTDNERRAEDVNRVVTAWLDENRKEPFFLFVHYFDPHFPYEPPEPFASTLADDLYAGEIAYVDHCIGELTGRLKQLELYDSAWLVITGDHGEALGDHGESTHGYFIYHSTTQVPLIIKPPRNRQPRKVEDLVGLIDIVPTILSSLGISVPSEVQGEDLSAYMNGTRGDGERRYLYSESLSATRYGCCSLLGIETGQWKYIQTSKPELYDLVRDPGETENLVDEHPELVGSLREHLRAMLATTTRLFDSEGEEVPGVDQDTIARLEALGYVGGRMQEDFSFETDKEDPKDFLEFYVKTSNANWLFRAGRFPEAKSICRDILSKRPDIAKIHEILGKMAYKERDFSTADAEFSEVMRVDPRSTSAYLWLAKVRAGQGRFDEAISLYREAKKLVTGLLGEDDTLDRALVQLGEVDPTLFQAGLDLANLLFERGRFGEAVEEYRELLQLDPLPSDRERFELMRAKAYYQLGVALSLLGRREEAIEAYREALQLQPDFAPARQALDASTGVRHETQSP